jgi:hypothetical protein
MDTGFVYVWIAALWLVTFVLCCYFAQKKKDGWVVVLIALLASPLVGLIVALFIEDKVDSSLPGKKKKRFPLPSGADPVDEWERRQMK